MQCPSCKLYFNEDEFRRVLWGTQEVVDGVVLRDHIIAENLPKCPGCDFVALSEATFEERDYEVEVHGDIVNGCLIRPKK